MSDTLARLEQQRAALLREIVALGDFRSGSVTAMQGRCGKPTGRCHQPGQPAHGPNFRLTRKVNGKTVSETFHTAAELRKARREVETFHRFRDRSQQLLEVNEQICQVRPIAQEEAIEQGKKRRKPSTRKSAAR